MASIFRLIETYEFFLELAGDTKLVRVELFESVDEAKLFRARAWLQNTYNLYPTFLNLGPQGQDLRQVHSSDQISMEITTTIAETPEWITGIKYESANDFFDVIYASISSFFAMLTEKPGQNL